MDGRYVSSIDSRHQVWGITKVNHNRFVTCGLDENIIYMWTFSDKNIVADDVSYRVDYYANGIHYNGTYYCVLHQTYNAITVLDKQGYKSGRSSSRRPVGRGYGLAGTYTWTVRHTIYTCRVKNLTMACCACQWKVSRCGSLP